MQILLVEDDPGTASFIRKGLWEHGYEVDVAFDGLSGRRRFEEFGYDLVILDIVLPHIDGFELCRQMRSLRSDLPILMLTGLSDTRDKVIGLEAGADDYLIKPFHFEELLARISALYRRKLRSTPGLHYQVADLELDPHRKVVFRAGLRIDLTATEYSLLELLVVNKNKILSREFISEAVWGISFERRTNLISVYINYLRAKIDKGAAIPLIYTIVNQGYVLKEPDGA